MQPETLNSHEIAHAAVQINPQDVRKSIGHETIDTAPPASEEADFSSANEEEPHVDTEPLKPQPDDECIAIMGMTGSGKSTFISMLANDQAPIGHGLSSSKSAKLDLFVY